MAFSAVQKLTLRQALGRTQLYPENDSAMENALTAIGDDPEAVTLAVTLLAQFEAAWAAYLNAGETAGIRTIDKDDVGFFAGNEAIAGKAKIGRTIVNRISILLGVDICADVFGTKGIGSPCFTWNHGAQYLAGIA